MKLLLSSRGLFLLGFLLLVATNIVVLSGVASNRSGELESEVTLTERELRLPYQVYEENSGLALRLRWRAMCLPEDYDSYPDWTSPAWLDAKKLESLGCNTKIFIRPENDDEDDIPTSPHEVFIVFESNSALYRDVVKWAKEKVEEKATLCKVATDDEEARYNFKEAKKQLKREEIAESRLFAIDAGLDSKKLRTQYADQSRFIITKGLVRAIYNQFEKKVYGHISELSVENIHVPLRHRQVFDSIIGQNKSNEEDNTHPPRFEVTLAYGKRFEPWIVSVKTIDDASD